MSETGAAILIPFISGVFTLIGVIVTVRANGRKQTEDVMAGVRDELKSQHEEFKVEQAVMTERINALTTEVREHNNFARRMPVVEEQIKSINHRLLNLEDDAK